MLAAEYISKLTLAWINVDQVKLELCIDRIYRALINGQLVLTAGNGGSASQAQHFAGELIDKFNLKLIDYGFTYNREKYFPKDDGTWFLLEK